MINDIVVGDSVSFSLYGSSGISNMTDVRVVSIVSGKNLTDNVIAAANHASIFPDIPQTLTNVTENDFRSYNYLTVESVNGEVITLTEIGIPWLIPSSVLIGDRLTAIITIPGFLPGQEASLAEVLSLYGFPQAQISLSVS